MRAACCLALMALGCAKPGPAPAAAKEARAASCEYFVQVTSTQPAQMNVRVRCQGRMLEGFVANGAGAEHIQLDGPSASLNRRGARFELSHPSDEAEIRYRVDLEALAAEAQSFDVALRVGRSLVAPASSYLLSPDPSGGPATVRFQVPAGVQLSTGMQRSGPDAYSIDTREIRVGTYSVLGSFDERSSRLPGLDGSAELDVAILDAPFDAGQPELSSWIDASAAAVGGFWGGFPTERALLVVVPRARRRQVLFGKVLPESRPGIALVVGQHAQRADLYDDWILVHELFHLGFPSFDGEGKWLDEGLATYYEPIIRARAGWIGEREIWSQFVQAMPRGIGDIEGAGLEKSAGFGGIYWGGAIVCLLADIAVRQRTKGERGLEDGLRVLLAKGGHSSEVWELARAIAVIDEALGAPTLAPLDARYAQAGEPLELGALWRKLGVERVGNGVRLHDDAPLASVRRAIVWGKPESSGTNQGSSARISGRSSP